MRKIVSGFAASFDGYIAGPNGEFDWILIDKEIDFNEQMKRYDTFFYGRKTYESVLGMNPRKTRGIKNYVFSTTLEKVHDAFELISADALAAIKKIRSEEGKDIALFGGAGLLASLLDMKQVDEIQVSVIPVLLGKGIPMVSELKSKVWLQLADTKRYGNGTIQLTYKVSYEKP